MDTTDLYAAFQDYNNDEPVASYNDDKSLPKRIVDREDSYKRRRLNQVISTETRGYAEIMRQREEQTTFARKKKQEEEKRKISWDDDAKSGSMPDYSAPAPGIGRRSSPTSAKHQSSRWDETPPTMAGLTPVCGIELATPTPRTINPEQYNLLSRHERDIEDRNLPFTDHQHNTMFPQQGYQILEPPASYVFIRKPPTPLGTPLYFIPQENRGQMFDVPMEEIGLPFIKPEDYQYFGALLTQDDELSPDERKIIKLLLKVKNGTPQQRKTALRQLTDKAREFGAAPLFNRILPLLMHPTLDYQERHLLVKVIDRLLYKLDDLVR
ncbi:splicing factor 3B subunit 1, partial [Tanacetum coccineum]